MIVGEGKRFRVEGPVTIDNVVAVIEEGRRLFAADEVEVDLSGVEGVDSSSISMLLEWLREAERCRRRLRVVNMPPNMESLASLYGLSRMIQQ